MAEDIYNLVDANRSHLGNWLPWVQSTQSSKDTSKFIQESITGFGQGSTLVCAIEYNGKLVGVIGYNRIFPALKKVELGYWIAAEMQGKGIATRVCSALIDYAFNDMAMEKIEIHVATENLSSRKLCERLEAKTEGIISQAEDIHGRIVDHVCYAIKKSDWPGTTQ